MWLIEQGDTVDLEASVTVTQLEYWLSFLNNTQSWQQKLLSPSKPRESLEKKISFSCTILVKQGHTLHPSPTSELPCWRWKETESADWAMRWSGSDCGLRSNSGKASPRGSLLWKGFWGELWGSYSWPHSGGCPPVQRTLRQHSLP